MNTQLESLQNAATRLGLTIHEYYQDDKRKTVKKFFATKGKTTVSPVLDYENLNHFLLGWNKHKHSIRIDYALLREQRDALLEIKAKTQPTNLALEGVVGLLDALIDEAYDCKELTEPNEQIH